MGKLPTPLEGEVIEHVIRGTRLLTTLEEAILDLSTLELRTEDQILDELPPRMKALTRLLREVQRALHETQEIACERLLEEIEDATDIAITEWIEAWEGSFGEGVTGLEEIEFILGNYHAVIVPQGPDERELVRCDGCGISTEIIEEQYDLHARVIRYEAALKDLEKQNQIKERRVLELELALSLLSFE
jgi:hypothetical protein